MSKGGRQAETQRVIQDVPEWAKDFFTGVAPGDDGTGGVYGLLPAAAARAQEPYQVYGGQRIAQDSPALTASQQMVQSIAGQPIAGFNEATSAMTGLGAAAQQLGQRQDAQFSASPFSATRVSPFTGFSETGVSPFTDFSAFQGGREYTGFESGAGMADTFQFDPARQFDAAERDLYMSPYMDAVVGRQQQDAIEQFQRAQAGRDASAVGAGAFGGSRHGVTQGIAEEALMRQLGDIRAEGSQRAFEQAQQQFERDRAAQMGRDQAQAQELARTQGISVEEAARVQQSIAAERARLQSMDAEEFARVQESQARELARVQGISVEEAARVQAAQAQELARVQGISVQEAARVQAGNAAEQARIQQARADEAMRQREFQLQAMGFSADMAREVANLGERARAGDIQAAQLLEAQGLGEMARDQARLDMAYEDFLRQQQFPDQQLANYAAILRGLPISDAGTRSVMEPQPSPFQQALGAGITGVSLYRGLT